MLLPLTIITTSATADFSITIIITSAIALNSTLPILTFITEEQKRRKRKATACFIRITQ